MPGNAITGLYRPPAFLGTRGADYRRQLRGEPCSYCPESPAGTLDHVQPRATGGRGQGHANKVPACQACNGEKGERSLLLFLLARL